MHIPENDSMVIIMKNSTIAITAAVIIVVVGIAAAIVAIGGGHPSSDDDHDRESDYYPVTVDAADLNGNMFSQTFNSEPRRIVTYMPQTAELMCLFGLQDRVVRAVSASPDDVCVHSGIQSTYSALAERAGVKSLPSQEELVADRPDLIIGWHSIFNYAGINQSMSVWDERGVNYYVVNRPADTLSDYTDMLMDIGTIFNMKERAQELIEEFESGVKRASERTKDLLPEDKHTAMFIEVRSDGTYNLYGSKGTSSLTGNLIAAAGGVNIIDTTVARASAELVDTLTPDYVFILVNTSIGTDEELAKAVSDFRSDPALASLCAQADGIYAFKLNDVFDGGVLPGDIVERLYEKMYGTDS